MSQIVLSGYITVDPDDLDKVHHALPRHLELTRAEVGCVTFSLEEDCTICGKFHVYEVFESQAAFEYHQRRASQSDWGEITAHMIRHYTITGLDSTAN